MQKRGDKSDQAFRELSRILEDAIREGADSIGLEYEDRDWIVYHNFGNSGLGAARIAKELQWDVINEFQKRAGLSRKTSGKMQICLFGKDFEVAVKTHESFGKSVYHITLKERQEKEEATVQQKKKKKKNPSAPIRWEMDPDIPTHDFLEEDALDNLDDTVHFFVDWLESGTFLAWEAVMCEEQDLPLNSGQKKALGDLLNFNDEDDDEILYINEIPRPSEPWYVILNKIVPHLLVEPFRTLDSHWEYQCEGWQQIASALQEQGQGLSLPPGAKSPEEVVPADLRHKLWLQWCFNDLDGLGQDEELTLENPEQMDRVDDFIAKLRECKDSVAHFGLTLESLMNRVILPERDQPIFASLMKEKLSLNSAKESIADRL